MRFSRSIMTWLRVAMLIASGFGPEHLMSRRPAPPRFRPGLLASSQRSAHLSFAGPIGSRRRMMRNRSESGSFPAIRGNEAATIVPSTETFRDRRGIAQSPDAFAEGQHPLRALSVSLRTHWRRLTTNGMISSISLRLGCRLDGMAMITEPRGHLPRLAFPLPACSAAPGRIQEGTVLGQRKDDHDPMTMPSFLSQSRHSSVSPAIHGCGCPLKKNTESS